MGWAVTFHLSLNMVNGSYWYSRFHSYLFTGHTTVSLQNGSNNDHHRVVSASSQSTRVFLVFNNVLTLTIPLWQTWIVLQSNLIMRKHTFPATIHKFLLMNNLWSSTVIQPEAISSPILSGSTHKINTPYYIWSTPMRRERFRLLTSTSLPASACGAGIACTVSVTLASPFQLVRSELFLTIILI